MKRRTGLALLTALALLLTGCSRAEGQAVPEEAIVLADTSGMDFSFSERELSGDYDAEGATHITGESGSVTIDGAGASLSGQNISIVDEGTYILSGEIRDHRITVVVPEDEKVQLVLAGAEIANANGPALYIRSADKVFLTLAEDTANAVADGTDYSLSEDDSSVDGAVFSRADLCINGSGSLRVSGNFKHGIVSKDDLVIANCSLDVSAKKKGLNGKDCVKVSGGEIRIESGTDGIQSDNDGDADRGYVYLKGTKLEITAGNDGIQAETVLKIVDTDMNIVSGGGSAQKLTEEDASCKGLKAGQDILLDGGSITIDSKDDCIHANGNAAVYAGSFALSSGDDGLHAEAGVLFADGNMEIAKSYEGVEGSEIRISGGSLRVTASDDGLNLSGGSDASSVEERPGRGMFDTVDGSIVISGGSVRVDAQGDGIDSNGSIYVSGGVTLVCGPTNGGNAAFDYGTSASVSGGILIAVGSAGMMQGFSAAENQGAVCVSFDPQQEGTPIVLCDADGNVIAGFTPVKDYQSAVITAPGLQQGGSYVLLAGAEFSDAGEDGFAASGTASGGTELMQIEMTSAIYGSGGMGFGGRGFGGMDSGGRGFGGGHGKGGMKDWQNRQEAEDFIPGLPEGMTPDDMPAMPEGMQPGEMPAWPEDMPATPGGSRPEGMNPPEMGFGGGMPMRP